MLIARPVDERPLTILGVNVVDLGGCVASDPTLTTAAGLAIALRQFAVDDAV